MNSGGSWSIMWSSVSPTFLWGIKWIRKKNTDWWIRPIIDNSTHLPYFLQQEWGISCLEKKIQPVLS